MLQHVYCYSPEPVICSPSAQVLPVFSALPSEVQTRIFEAAPPGKRKCV